MCTTTVFPVAIITCRWLRHTEVYPRATVYKPWTTVRSSMRRMWRWSSVVQLLEWTPGHSCRAGHYRWLAASACRTAPLHRSVPSTRSLSVHINCGHINPNPNSNPNRNHKIGDLSTGDVRSWHVHCVSKNAPPLSCYNLDIHDPTVVIFGRSVIDKARKQTMFSFPTSPERIGYKI